MPTKRQTEARWIENANRWQVNVTSADGNRKTFVSSKPGKKGKLEAERKADDWLFSGSFESLRLSEAWEKFLSTKRRTCGTPWVKKLESIGNTWILPKLGHKKVAAITQQNWQDRINEAFRAGKSKKTLENIRGAISGFYVFCDMNRIEMEEPRRLKIPDGAAVGGRKILQPDDIKTLFEQDSITHYGKPKPCFYIHAWRFIVLLGLRRGELAGIQHSDIKDGVLHISRSINSLGEQTRGKTENAKRAILLPECAKKVLADQAEMLKRNGIATRTWVFPGPDGGMADTNAIYKQWSTFRKQHGLQSSLHELRHTAVSLLKTELPEDLLKQLVGHSAAMDTSRYKHEVAGDLLRTSSVIDAVFDRIIK